MKSKSIKIAALSLACISTLSLATSCGDSGKTKLKIIALEASYGITWIEELEKEFEKLHPEIDVDLTTSYSAGSLIESHLNSSNNPDDLYISVGTNWKTNAAEGYFASLDELLEDTVDGVTIKDKVSDEYKNSIYYTKSDGTKSCYRLPWTAGIGGIYYNAKMFKDNKWDTWLKTTYPGNTSGTPETFEQLLALCNKINKDQIPVPNNEINAVKPFAYSGANSDYFDYLVFNWWSQIAGTDAINEFLKYESALNFDSTQNETYAALKTATSYWAQIFTNPANVIEGSESKTAANAQKEFFTGAAAMMVNGDWLYNDSLPFAKNGVLDLRLMKTPSLPESKNTNSAYVIGEDQFVAIPESSKNKDLAKEFIKLMISDKGCEIFLEKGHGFLAYKADYSKFNIAQNDEYIKSAIEIRNSYENKYTNFSNNRKYLCNFIDIWCTGAQRPYIHLINGTSTSVDASFSSIAYLAQQNWELWTNQSK